MIYIDPKQVVKDFQIGVSIEESRDITTVRVPPLRNDLEQAVNQTGTHWSMDEIAGATCVKIRGNTNFPHARIIIHKCPY